MQPKAMNQSVLPEQIKMGKVTLLVKSIAEMKKFYADTIGLTIHSEKSESTILGDVVNEIIELKERGDLPLSSSRDAGLYHTAILFDSRATLAKTLVKVISTYPKYFQGTADHKVSEAFYFSDPEGNGVELYFDKPKETWQWQDGSIVMGSEYIDPLQYIERYENSEVTTNAIQVGHVHLRVGNIAEAKQFYNEILGFNMTAEMPTALFMSKNKYHHHLGMNVWESNGAPKVRKTLGLEKFEILMNKEALKEAIEILKQKSIPFTQQNNEVLISDPWGTVIVLRESVL